MTEFDGILRIEHHRLAVGLDLFAAPRPKVRIGEGRRIAEGVAERLPDRVAGRLQLLADRAVFLPSRGNGVSALLGQPGLAIDDHGAEHAPRHPQPFLAIVGDDLRLLIEAALRLADLLDDVVDIADALGIELRPVVQAANDVGAGAGLDRRGGARLQIVAVDRLDIELDAESLLGLGRDLLLQERVGGGNEVIPAQPVNRCALRVGGSARRGEYRGDAAGLRRDRTRAGELKKLSPMNPSHLSPPCRLNWSFDVSRRRRNL